MVVKSFSTRGKDKTDIERSFAKPGDMINGKPLVVLINHGSASASEIVAGAIQDNGRGVIMGSQSFGKGSVQQQKPFGDGTAIHLTIARYYTPSGRSIQNTGITPDVEVLQSKVEKIEKRESFYSEASFRNALKNEEAEKKAKKKAEDTKKKDEDDDDDRELTDEEKDARDYQLQRGMEMVIALSKMAEHARTAAEPKSDSDENDDKESDKK